MFFLIPFLSTRYFNEHCVVNKRGANVLLYFDLQTLFEK